MYWQTSRHRVDLSSPKVMGIVNLTPDSFSDGGRLQDVKAAMAHCEALLVEGADILDLGAESSRPGVAPVPLETELARLLPVLRQAVRLGVPVSVDTCKAQVMCEALDLGADIVNDIWALRLPGSFDVVAAHPSCGICLMHMHGEPLTMQLAPMPGDAVTDVRAFLSKATRELLASGVQTERIVWDAGIGFGKTVAQNFALLARQDELLVDGFPLLVGWSRKSSIGAVTGLALPERMVPSVAAALLAVERGARVVRVHDVAQTIAALKMWAATISGAAIRDNTGAT